MIDKRLIKALPQAKKYVWLTVVMREIALLSSSALIFAVAALMERRGQDWQNPVACIILCGALVFSMNLLSAYTGIPSAESGGARPQPAAASGGGRRP